MAISDWTKFAPAPKPLSQGKLYNVFLSYRSINRPWVLNLYDVLVELEYKVYLDQYVLKAGDMLVSNLQKALTNSMAGVLIWSNAAKDSTWVEEEYNSMLNISKNDPNFFFVPLKMDKVDMPLFAKNRVYIDFSDYPDGPNGGDLLRLLHAINGLPLSPDAIKFANEQDVISKDFTAKVNAAIKNGYPEKLLKLFEEGGLPWETSASLGCRVAEGLIKLKQNNDALVVLDKLILKFDKALRPQQLKGLALARRGNEGDLELAQETLGVLYEKNFMDPETMGIYARTWMDRYDQSKNILHLKRSRDLYAEAFEKAPDDYYTGINAAAKSVLIGTEQDLELASELAQKVEYITGKQAVAGDYWKTATIAEVLLIQKKYEEAGKMYEKAVNMAISEIGSHESTFKQAKKLMDKLGPNVAGRESIERAFAHLG
jgi:tetratricopeptide (TPR) repeat protein